MDRQLTGTSEITVRPGNHPIVVHIPQTRVVVPAPKVVINQPPADPWLTYWVPNLTLLFAFIAAAVGGVSLKRMRQQIELAQSQIKQQDKAIELATKDFAATIEALGITKRQAELADAERGRTPLLVMRCQGELGPLNLAPGFHDLRFYVHNEGDKPASEVRAMLAFSDNFVDRLDEMDQIQRMTESLYAMKDRKRFRFNHLTDFGGIKMFENSARVDGAVIQGPGSFVGHADVYLSPGKYLVACKISSAEAEWPEDGFQPIEIDVK